MPWKEKPDRVRNPKRSSEAGRRGGLSSAKGKADWKKYEATLRVGIGTIVPVIVELKAMLALAETELATLERQLELCLLRKTRDG